MVSVMAKWFKYQHNNMKCKDKSDFRTVNCSQNLQYVLTKYNCDIYVYFYLRLINS